MINTQQSRRPLHQPQSSVLAMVSSLAFDLLMDDDSPNPNFYRRHDTQPRGIDTHGGEDDKPLPIQGIDADFFVLFYSLQPRRCDDDQRCNPGVPMPTCPASKPFQFVFFLSLHPQFQCHEDDQPGTPHHAPASASGRSSIKFPKPFRKNQVATKVGQKPRENHPGAVDGLQSVYILTALALHS